MQRLLEAPKPPKVEDPTPAAAPQETVELAKEEAPVEAEIQTQAKDDGQTTLVEKENKRIPEPEKRGCWSRFLDPMINHDCLTNMNKVVKHWSKNRRGT